MRKKTSIINIQLLGLQLQMKMQNMRLFQHLNLEYITSQRKMYLDIISGKTVLSSYDKQLLTDVSISKTKIDLGTFSWNDAQEVEIQISNVGKNTLVMNDVITSCGCISVEYSKEPIQSNKVLSMKIKYKAEHPEHFDKTITIYCNIKDAPLRLKISGNAE